LYFVDLLQKQINNNQIASGNQDIWWRAKICPCGILKKVWT